MIWDFSVLLHGTLLKIYIYLLIYLFKYELHNKKFNLFIFQHIVLPKYHAAEYSWC